MQARDIMTKSVVTVRPDTSVKEAATILCQHAITAAPVLNRLDHLVGIVSEADLLRRQLPHDPRTHLRPETDEEPPHTVADVMTRSVVCLPPFTDAADVAATMLETNVRSIPLVEESHIVGIVSRRDLLGTLVRDDAAIRSEIAERLHHCFTPRRTWQVDVHKGMVRITAEDFGETDQRIALALSRTVPGVIRVSTVQQDRSMTLTGPTD
jgi:CBS domain-containing protein